MGTTAQIGNIGPFDITSYSWGPQHAAVAASSGSDGGDTQAQSSDMIITKGRDANSNRLFQASAAGTAFDSATITVTFDGGRTMVFQFSSVFIASYVIGGGEQGSDSMDWNFAKVSISYSSLDNPDDASGGSSSGSLATPGYDLAS